MSYFYKLFVLLVPGKNALGGLSTWDGSQISNGICIRQNTLLEGNTIKI